MKDVGVLARLSKIRIFGVVPDVLRIEAKADRELREEITLADHVGFHHGAPR